MSCENHKREIAGITDMKQLAEMIGDLHYETLAELMQHLKIKLFMDGNNDIGGKRHKLGCALSDAAMKMHEASKYIRKAWLISKPFMQTDFKCPSCGRPWDPDITSSCECGANAIPLKYV